MPQALGNLIEFHEQTTSAPECGSEISNMVSSHELGIEVESLAHESNPDPPFLPEYSRQDYIMFRRKVEIISKEQFVSNIAQTIPRLKKIQNDSKIPDHVHQNISEAMSLLKMDLNRKGLGKRPNINSTKKTNKKCCNFKAAKDARDQDDDMINVKVDHSYNEPPHTESSPILNETIHDETPPASPRNIQSFQERVTIKHDTMGQDMTDIMLDPGPKVSSSTHFQGIFLSCIEEFGYILNYYSNITQESWKRGLDNINSIYKN
ncbi:hypothetical protein O181_015259 [Austropuccinia psidii MF-1]|uniref:Uncharacterized protein n=1 Tax=Austropuccinia psidii MF-1 TaxID=1389203 RepID=A0A9Q3BZN0_9BASI|nr:hypothetical protein [Austropuccinia psidii MF-1]